LPGTVGQAVSPAKASVARPAAYLRRQNAFEA
jgi:hypothetical protein